LEAAALIVTPVVAGAGSVRDKTQPKPDENGNDDDENGEDEGQDKQARAADAI
jgi:hypothetical protein